MIRVRTLAVVIVSVLIALSAIAFAQESDEMQGQMMSKEMKGSRMKKHPMGDMMMKKMGDRQMLATEDGGVIIWAGNKLIKYDKDLNLVKEVELEIDSEAMEKMMEKMKEKCAIWMKEKCDILIKMKEEGKEKKE